MKKKVVSVLLAVCLVLSFCQMAVSAEGSKSITVDLSVFDGSFIMPKKEITVYDGVAEAYGYQVAEQDHNGVQVNDVTFFDVLVQAHKDYYGDLFTKETAKDYLVMNNGYITLAFGKSAGATQFVVNDVIPTDGILNPEYNSYTSYACDTARIKDHDDITYFYFQDRTYYADYYTYFDRDNLQVESNIDITLNLRGYCAMWYGFSDADVIAQNTVNIPQVDVYITSDGKEYAKVGQTDENGNVTFSVENAGDYLVCAKGSFEDQYGATVPIVSPWCALTVTDSEKSITVLDGSNLKIDAQTGIICGLTEGENTVANITQQLSYNGNFTLSFTSLSGQVLSENSLIGTGTVIQLLDENQNVIDSLTVVLYGDVTGDGAIDVFDVSLLRAYIAYEIQDSEISGAQIASADVNDDQNIDELDLVIFNLASIFATQISQRGSII